MHARSHRGFLCAFCAAIILSAGCGGGGGPAAERDLTRRGVEGRFISSHEYGNPRGRPFEDIIPVGARITAVHVTGRNYIEGIWLSYERDGEVTQTPCRGRSAGEVRTFTLDRDEWIVALHAWGRSTIDGFALVTNKRAQTIGVGSPSQAWARTLRNLDRDRCTAVGITGRADYELRQLCLRIQVRDEGLTAHADR